MIETNINDTGTKVTPMKIFKIYQNSNKDYDTYDSAVVIANTAFDAVQIHPNTHVGKKWCSESWVHDVDLVEVIYIGDVVGEPDKDIYPGAVINASFNAG